MSRISVDSLTGLSGPPDDLLLPTDAMKAAGQSTVVVSAKKVFRVHTASAATADAVIRAVCIFGVVSPAGKLVEAHSLQPADPNSEAALEDARQIDFSPSTSGATPRQRFVFVIERFFSPQ